VGAFLTMNAVTSAGDVEEGGLFSRKRLSIARLGLDGGDVGMGAAIGGAIGL